MNYLHYTNIHILYGRTLNTIPDTPANRLKLWHMAQWPTNTIILH